MLHFLVDDHDREAYVAQLRRALEPDGTFVIGTFAEDGPSHCSGLPTARYAPEDLAGQFPDYRVLRAASEQHRTPRGRIQPFTWLLLADARPDGN